MRIAITGGTGFVGSALVRSLVEQGDEVIVISRGARLPQALSHERSGAVSIVSWEELERRPDQLEGIDGIVNLAGESINQRWTEAAKTRVLRSRIKAAERVAKLVNALEEKPKVVVNASGVSSYGTSLSETFDEDSPGRVVDFLSSVVKEWEAAADRIPVNRLVKLRVGLVIGKQGGAFPLMALPYRLFGGGRVGTGKQWISWIHIEDMVRLILFCLRNEEIAGPVNGVSPDPVTNDDFGRALGRAMGRPHWFPVPALLMKLLLGEMSVLLLDGQRALPKKALEHGFEFRFPTIDGAMRDLLHRNAPIK